MKGAIFGSNKARSSLNLHFMVLEVGLEKEQTMAVFSVGMSKLVAHSDVVGQISTVAKRKRDFGGKISFTVGQLPPLESALKSCEQRV